MEEDRPVSNLPYDESVDVSDAEDVPTALSITPRAQPMQPNLSHCSDEVSTTDTIIEINRCERSTNDWLGTNMISDLPKIFR